MFPIASADTSLMLDKFNIIMNATDTVLLTFGFKASTLYGIFMMRLVIV